MDSVVTSHIAASDTPPTPVATANKAAAPQRSNTRAPSSGASRIIVFCPAWMAPHVAPMAAAWRVETKTRTFAFYLPLDNEPRTFAQDGKTHFVWRYRPGQRVRLRMPVEKLVTMSPDGKREIQPFVFPAGAVVREGPEAYMFVQSGDVFIRKPVRVLYADRSEAVVANDGNLSEVEYVVRNHAAAINRAIKAQAAGGGGDPHAGHNH